MEVEALNWPITEIVSGGAIGADRLGMRFAREFDYRLTIFYPGWEKYNKAAGFIRNKKMANYADALIAFWDGKSRGTFNMIEEAGKLGLVIKIVEVKNAVSNSKIRR